MNEQRLQSYLHEQQVPYEIIHHARAITARTTAASAHIRNNMLAKTVMVKLDGRLAMVVLPASQRVHLGLLRHVTGSNTAELALESEFCDHFPDCEVGAMPPFGHLYGMEVYVDDRLATDQDVAFNAGTHTDLMRMSFKEFERLEAPKHIHLSH